MKKMIPIIIIMTIIIVYNNYKNPKINHNEKDKSKKYSEKDEENIKIPIMNDFTSSAKADKNINRYDRDDDRDIINMNQIIHLFGEY